nr:hypothetical protein CFP56_57579 [Quercus suber]
MFRRSRPTLDRDLDLPWIHITFVTTGRDQFHFRFDAVPPDFGLSPHLRTVAPSFSLRLPSRLECHRLSNGEDDAQPFIALSLDAFDHVSARQEVKIHHSRYHVSGCAPLAWTAALSIFPLSPDLESLELFC